jgi:hypothetical protein
MEISMNFLIDYDTRMVECKCEQSDTLEAYIEDNGLELAVTIVADQDDLVMDMSLKEISQLYHNYAENKREFKDEDEAAKFCWDMIVSHADNIKDYTPALGKKLLQAGKARSSDNAKPATAASAKPVKADSKAASKPVNKRVKLEQSDMLAVIDSKCKKGSILHTIVTAIEVELCETVEEVTEYITSNHVIPKTGELADTKFADHNIKYFVKQGKISAEEGL